MKNRNDVEELLGRFSMKPSPPGLREKILSAVHKEKKSRSLMSPGLKIICALCAFLIGFSLLFDWQVTRHQERRILSVLQATPVLGTSDEYADQVLVTELGDEYKKYFTLASRKKEAVYPRLFPFCLKEKFDDN
jgi:hypothetical protein